MALLVFLPYLSVDDLFSFVWISGDATSVEIALLSPFFDLGFFFLAFDGSTPSMTSISSSPDFKPGEETSTMHLVSFSDVLAFSLPTYDGSSFATRAGDSSSVI